MSVIQFISGLYVKESIRFLGDPLDTIVGQVLTSDDEKIAVKGKDFKWLGVDGVTAELTTGQSYSFFGKWAKYFNARTKCNEKQWAYFGYCNDKNTEDVQRLHEQLIGRGFPRELACRLLYEVGIDAVDIVLRNPFFLMKYDRVGFKRCDDMWLDLGLNPNRIKRQTLCLENSMNETDGSVWFIGAKASGLLTESIKIADANPKKAISLGRRSGLIRRVWTDGLDGDIDSINGDVEWLASDRLAKKEIELVDSLVAADAEPSRWSRVEVTEMSGDQCEAVERVTSSNIGCLIGGGGTGKTYCVARLVKCLIEMDGGVNDILLCAPTGKAAVRITEAMASEGVQAVRGRTIHSALYKWAGDLPFGTIIVDESSMIDLELMNALMRARRPATRILFVGDPYQLSPVGPGAPFRDMVSVLNSVGELKEIRRNAGTIALAGKSIREGQRFQIDDGFNFRENENLMCLPGDNSIHGVLKAVEILKAETDFDPIWEIQILAIVNKRSDCGAQQLNEALQQHFNPKPRIIGTPFRVDDKVMQTSNSWMIPDRSHPGGISPDADVNARTGMVYVANGEIGRVLDVNSQWMTVEMLSPKRIVRAYRKTVEEGSEEGMTGSDFVLAYAITTHKSQGSQWPAIVAVIDGSSGASRLMDRSLIYTMITRASKACILVGDIEVAYHACRKASIDKRKTFLKELYRAKSSIAVS